MRINYLCYFWLSDLCVCWNLLLFSYCLCFQCFLLNSSIYYFYIFGFTMHLFYTFDKLVHIDLVIPILINFLYHFLKLSLDLTINLTAKHHPDLLSTNLTIFIAIKQIKSLPKPILLLLFLLFQPKRNKLTKLQGIIIIKI